MSSVEEDVAAAISHPLARRILGEFKEMPGLKLTVSQAQRLFGLGRSECESLLRTLTNAHLLARTRDDSYVLASTAP